MTKTEELLAAAHWLERDGANCERHLQIALELREYAATLDAEPVALREVGLNRDVSGMCIVTINGREAIRDNGDVISHYATLDWFAQPPAPLTDEEIDTLRGMNIVRNKGALNSLAFARAVLAAQQEKK